MNIGRNFASFVTRTLPSFINFLLSTPSVLSTLSNRVNKEANHLKRGKQGGGEKRRRKGDSGYKKDDGNFALFIARILPSFLTFRRSPSSHCGYCFLVYQSVCPLGIAPFS